MRRLAISLLLFGGFLLAEHDPIPSVQATGKHDPGAIAQTEKERQGKEKKPPRIDTKRPGGPARFSKDEEKTIRDWFADKKNLQGLPPGGARADLSIGPRHHLDPGSSLPPDLQKRMQPLPKSLEKRLPKPPEGVRRVVVGGDVILLEEQTSKVLDVLPDVVM